MLIKNADFENVFNEYEIFDGSCYRRCYIEMQ